MGDFIVVMETQFRTFFLFLWVGGHGVSVDIGYENGLWKRVGLGDKLKSERNANIICDFVPQFICFMLNK